MTPITTEDLAMTDIHIRLAEPHHIPEIHRLLREFASYLGDAQAYKGSVDDLERHGFGAQRLFTCLLACRDSRALGMVLFFPEFSTWRGRSGFYIQDLYVDQDVRGEGLGKRLLHEAWRHAETHWQAEYVKLSAHCENVAAIKFYQRVGFTLDAENPTLLLDDPTNLRPIS